MESTLSAADNEPNFVKYESICSILPTINLDQFLGKEVQVFEKIDGGNCQVRKVPTQTGGFGLLGGSRANFLKGTVVQRREWFQEFTKWMYQNSSLYNLPENLVMFNEFAGNHTITYSPDFNNKPFLIDLLDQETRRFLPYDESRKRISQLGIENVLLLNVLFKGQITEKVMKELLKKNSEYYPGHKEGIVIKDYNSNPQTFAKVLHPEFAEKKLKKDGQIDYLTPSRYKKVILRWLDENEVNTGIDESSYIDAVRENVIREEKVDCDRDRVRRRLRLYLHSGKLKQIEKYLSK